MGEIADQMINGEICQYCEAYLHPGEIVYIEIGNEKTKIKMPANGEEMGVPVICNECMHE